MNEDRLAWAVARGDAVAWAHRNVGLHGEGESVVIRGRVARENELLEMEVLAFPEHVAVDAVENVGDEAPPPPPDHRKIQSA